MKYTVKATLKDPTIEFEVEANSIRDAVQEVEDSLVNDEKCEDLWERFKDLSARYVVTDETGNVVFRGIAIEDDDPEADHSGTFVGRVKLQEE